MLYVHNMIDEGAIDVGSECVSVALIFDAVEDITESFKSNKSFCIKCDAIV